MSRKSKINAVEKIKIVEQYLNGTISQIEAAKLQNGLEAARQKNQQGY